MSDRNLIPISAHPRIGKINEAEYFRLYERSLADPDGFWGEQGRRLDWIKPYSKVGNASFTGDVSIRWYEDGTLNASYGLDDVYEFEYVPAKSFTDLCLAVVPGSTTVTLQACGRTARTIWIADQAAANGAYAPLISGTDTASPAALALTATKVGATFTVTPLTKKGAAATDQMWQTISGVLPA